MHTQELTGTFPVHAPETSTDIALAYAAAIERQAKAENKLKLAEDRCRDLRVIAVEGAVEVLRLQRRLGRALGAQS